MTIRLSGPMAVALVLIGMPAALGAPACGGQATQLAMNECAADRLAAADQKLNASYRALLAKVSPKGREALTAAQRAWVAYRDRECAFETLGTADGSIHPFVLQQCLEGVTLQQEERLRMQARCPEGDLSCGGQ